MQGIALEHQVDLDYLELFRNLVILSNIGCVEPILWITDQEYLYHAHHSKQLLALSFLVEKLRSWILHLKFLRVLCNPHQVRH